MLATSRDLVRFHADRALIYQLLAEVLGTPPTADQLRAVAERLGEAGARAAPGAALALALGASEPEDVGAQYGLLLGAPDGPLGCRCRDTAEPSRHEAFLCAGRLEDGHASSEAQVLAALAERSAQAIRQDELAEAAALLDLQHRFLARHARRCLGELARRLAGSGADFYARVGGVLDELTREDLSLLDHAPRPTAAPP